MLGCKEFVNSDEIAKGLSPFNADSIAVAVEANQIMYKRIRELISANKTFALETTLASRSIARLLQNAQEKGYYVTLLYFWLNTPDLAVERVRNRVMAGGHNVTESTVRRHYVASIQNLFQLYRNLDMLGHPNAIWAIRRATPSLRDPMTPMTPAVGTDSSALHDFVRRTASSLSLPLVKVAPSHWCFDGRTR